VGAPLWRHHNASNLFDLKVIRWAVSKQVSANLDTEVRDDDELLEDVLGKNVSVARLFDIIAGDIDVVGAEYIY